MPDAVRSGLGLETVLLDAADVRTFVVAHRDQPAEVAGCVWTPSDDVARQLQDRPAVITWIGQRRQPIRAWFEPGWHELAIGFIDRALSSVGAQRTGDVDQLRHWPVSCVVRAPTSQGNHYLKAVPEGDVYEPDLLDVFARLGVPHVPQSPLASDAASRWWLTTEHAGRQGSQLSERDRLPALRALAEVQQVSVDEVDLLESAGILRSNPADLVELVPAILTRDDLWTAQPAAHEQWRGLTDAQQLVWKGLGPWLTDSCLELAESLDWTSIPLTVTHGDFRPGNTLHGSDRVNIHDWATAQITHPFLDLGTWIDDMTEVGAREHLDAYFHAWAGFASVPEATAIWRSAKPVSGLVALDRAIRHTEEFGPAHSHAMIAVVYGWVRRLVGASLDRDADYANWPAPP